MSLIEIENLEKKFGSHRVLDQLNIELDGGQIVGLLGPNGSGKTTLFRILAGLEKNYSGTVKINGEPISTDTKSIVSYQPDHLALQVNKYPHQLVETYKYFFEDFDSDYANELFKRFNLPMDKKLNEMSKGMQDKIQIALTLARRAKVFLLDEPISGVDPSARKEIIDAILDGFDGESLIILSTHMASAIEPLLDQVIFLGDGKIVLQSNVDDLRLKYEKDLEEVFQDFF